MHKLADCGSSANKESEFWFFVVVISTLLLQKVRLTCALVNSSQMYYSILLFVILNNFGPISMLSILLYTGFNFHKQ